MSNERITSRFLVMVLVAMGCGFSTIEENPGYCVNNGGDRFCELRGDGRDYCSLGTPNCPAQDVQAYDGCVDKIPRDDCYSPCGDVSMQFDASCLLENTSSYSPESSSSSEDATGSGEGSAGGADTTHPAEQPYQQCVEGAECVMRDSVCYHYIPGHDFCAPRCDAESPCPMPDGVTATPLCVMLEMNPNNRACVLECLDGDECPEGMVCADLVYQGIRLSRCAWSN